MSWCNAARLKMSLYISNLIFLVLGITILVFGVMYYHAHAEFSLFVNDNYSYLSYILMGIGSLTFVIAFFGCCGALKQNNCLMGTFAALVMIILLAEIVATVGVYVFYSDVMALIEYKMNETFKLYFQDPDIKKTWDLLHYHLKCCAIHGLVDFGGGVPLLSCCKFYRFPNQSLCGYKDIYEEGCLENVENMIFKHILIIEIVGGMLMAIELFLVGVACFLAEIYRTQTQ